MEICTFCISPTSFGSIAPYSDPFMDVETIEDVDGPEDTIVTSNENPVTLRYL